MIGRSWLREFVHALAGDWGQPASPDPHDGYTCAEMEARCEDLEGQVNDAAMVLARAGYEVDVRRLGRSVRDALVAASGGQP